jgi:hypothetical protein
MRHRTAVFAALAIVDAAGRFAGSAIRARRARSDDIAVDPTPAAAPV